jgi:hypothetical protein
MEEIRFRKICIPAILGKVNEQPVYLEIVTFVTYINIYMENINDNYKMQLMTAVSEFWKTRNKQLGNSLIESSQRGAVTGGAQMNGFIELISDIVVNAGINKSNIFYSKSLELPGFFRPTKKWDLLVVKDGELIVALETKSQVGPSFGNNFNNRTEEAMGSALDLWTAFREGALNKKFRPFLGYLFLLEDCNRCHTPVRVEEPHFKVLPEFAGSSYAKRYELFCRKLVREKHYDAASFIMSSKDKGPDGNYSEPADDLIFSIFARAIGAFVAARA